jgi:hypothetical protein
MPEADMKVASKENPIFKGEQKEDTQIIKLN